MDKDLIMSSATKRAESLLSEMTTEEMSELTNELTMLDGMNPNFLYNRSKEIANVVVDLKELMMMYSCAMKEVRTKLEILNVEYNIRYQRNPINSINTRLKRLTSILSKLEKKNAAVTLENIEGQVSDIAGVRVVCSYVDDIYVIAEALKNQSDIELISQKDYIANPKENGYRSLHLIISIPVFFTNHMKKMKVEVQIRTIAMDFWATLEHQMKYKQDLINGEMIAENLKECAESIAYTDVRMMSIRKQIEANSEEMSDDDILFEKIQKIDIPIE